MRLIGVNTKGVLFPELSPDPLLRAVQEGLENPFLALHISTRGTLPRSLLLRTNRSGDLITKQWDVRKIKETGGLEST